MEFAPRDTVMKWAQQVAGLEEYADHRIVLMTHAYLDAKDQRLSGPCKVTSYEPLVRNGRIVKIKGLPLPDASNGFLAPVRHFAHYAAVRLDARREERIYVPLQQIRPGYGIVPNLK